MRDLFTDEEYNIVDKVRMNLQDEFNKEWNKMSDVMKECFDERIFVKWKKEKKNENG